MLKFLIWFILLSATNYGLDYIFRPTKVDLFRDLFSALGLAFGISFIDITFLKGENQENIR